MLQAQVYEGSCKLIQNSATGLSYQGDQEFWNLVHRAPNQLLVAITGYCALSTFLTTIVPVILSAAKNLSRHRDSSLRSE